MEHIYNNCKGTKTYEGECRACLRKKARQAVTNPKLITYELYKWVMPSNAALVRHKLTHEQAASILDIQNRGCGICSKKNGTLEIDHDHSCCHRTGTNTCGICIRGMLCHSCNTRLGRLGDSSIKIVQFQKFLRSSAGKYQSDNCQCCGNPPGFQYVTQWGNLGIIRPFQVGHHVYGVVCDDCNMALRMIFNKNLNLNVFLKYLSRTPRVREILRTPG